MNLYTTFSFTKLQEKHFWLFGVVVISKVESISSPLPLEAALTLLALCQLATSTTLHANAVVTSLLPRTGEDVHSAGLRSSSAWWRTERHCQSDHISPSVKWERWTRTQRTDSSVDRRGDKSSLKEDMAHLLRHDGVVDLQRQPEIY